MRHNRPQSSSSARSGSRQNLVTTSQQPVYASPFSPYCNGDPYHSSGVSTASSYYTPPVYHSAGVSSTASPYYNPPAYHSAGVSTAEQIYDPCYPSFNTAASFEPSYYYPSINTAGYYQQPVYTASGINPGYWGIGSNVEDGSTTYRIGGQMLAGAIGAGAFAAGTELYHYMNNQDGLGRPLPPPKAGQ